MSNPHPISFGMPMDTSSGLDDSDNTQIVGKKIATVNIRLSLKRD